MIAHSALTLVCLTVVGAVACSGSEPLNADAAMVEAREAAADAAFDNDRLPDVGAFDVGAPDVNARTDAGFCNPVQIGLQQISDTPASPYYVHHAATDDPRVPTVIFIGGGTGGQAGAQRTWDLLSRDPRALNYQIVIPYAAYDDFIDEAVRTYDILDEVLHCFGGDPARVHLSGRSNGGYAAFALMLGRPGRFVTLLGAPGLFPRYNPTAWGTALGGKSIFNGVGELDDGWRADVRMTHAGLVSVGVNSVYVEFPGETHRFSATFNPGVFFDFWGAH